MAAAFDRDLEKHGTQQGKPIVDAQEAMKQAYPHLPMQAGKLSCPGGPL